MAKSHIEQLQDAINANRKRLLVREQNEIVKIYDKAFHDAYNDLIRSGNLDKKSATYRAKVIYVKQLHDELLKLEKENNAKLAPELTGLMNRFVKTKFKTQINDPEFQQLLSAIDKKADITNRWLIDTMVKGKIYKPDANGNPIGLSTRLWKAANSAGDKIDFAIASMFAQGKGAAEVAKTLSQFGKGGHRTWDKNKIKEKLGPGYARKYSSGLDYEALRLARTTSNHMAQLAMMNERQINPYAGAMKWHSNHTGGNVCDLCISRATGDHEGLGPGIYLMEHVPFDHPNGYCHTSLVWIMNGKVISPTEMANDIGKWIRGEKNSGMMDKLYGDIPVSPKWLPKSVEPPKEAKPKLTAMEEFQQYIAANGVDRMDSKYNKLRKAAFKELSEDVSKTRKLLQKNYDEMTELEMIRYNQMRELYNKKQKAAYQSYVQTGHSFDINRHMYEGKYKPGGRNKLDKEVDALKELIATQKLNKDAQFVRFSGLDYLNYMLNQVGSDFKYQRSAPGPVREYNLLQLNNALKDKVITNDSFTSVSYDKNANVFTNKPMMLEIYAKEGTEALHTMNYRESELVLQAGTKFKVRGIELVQEKDKYGDDYEYLKVMMETVSE